MPGQAANRYYLPDKKGLLLFPLSLCLSFSLSRRVERMGCRTRGRGARERREDWFLPLKSSLVVEQNSRIPEDPRARARAAPVTVEFDLAPETLFALGD